MKLKDIIFEAGAMSGGGVVGYMGEEDTSLDEKKQTKKDDRCTRIAKRKYRRWPSAYASGAVVQCRRGRIWRDLKEEFENLDLDEEYVDAYHGMNEEEQLEEEVLVNPEEVNEEIIELLLNELLSEGKRFKAEKEKGLHGWFSRNRGKGWIDCRTGGPCGREKGEKRKYPACRPTKAMCNKVGPRRKKGRKPVSWVPKSKQK